MVAVGLIVMWFGYQQAIYGWVLLKGWDVTWRKLASPVNPFQWPGTGDPPAIPAGQILPGGAGKNPLGVAGPPAAAAQAPGQQKINRIAGQAHRASPGSVAGRL